MKGKLALAALGAVIATGSLQAAGWHASNATELRSGNVVKINGSSRDRDSSDSRSTRRNRERPAGAGGGGNAEGQSTTMRRSGRSTACAGVYMYWDTKAGRCADARNKVIPKQ
jgi:hypothetical protein